MVHPSAFFIDLKPDSAAETSQFDPLGAAEQPNAELQLKVESGRLSGGNPGLLAPGSFGEQIRKRGDVWSHSARLPSTGTLQEGRAPDRGPFPGRRRGKVRLCSANFNRGAEPPPEQDSSPEQNPHLSRTGADCITDGPAPLGGPNTSAGQ